MYAPWIEKLKAEAENAKKAKALASVAEDDQAPVGHFHSGGVYQPINENWPYNFVQIQQIDLTRKRVYPLGDGI